MAGLLMTSFLVLMPAVILGFRVLKGSARRVLLASWGLVALVFAIGYDIVDPEPYLIPVVVVLTVLAAVGVEYVREQWVTSAVLYVAFLAVFVVIMANPPQNVVNTSWSDKNQLETDMRTWLTTLSPDSILALYYTEASMAWNLVSIGGVKSDVPVLQVEADELSDDHLGGERCRGHEQVLLPLLRPTES